MWNKDNKPIVLFGWPGQNLPSFSMLPEMVEKYPSSDIILYSPYERETGPLVLSESLKEDLFLSRKRMYTVLGSYPVDPTYYREYTHLPSYGNTYEFFPTSFFRLAWDSLLNAKKISITGEVLKKPSRQPGNLYICLNNQPHRHRVLTIDTLHREKLHTQGHITWHYPEAAKNSNLLEHWTPEHLVLDSSFVEDKNSYKNIPEEYYTSAVVLITEACTEVPFITEKTVTALLLERPFITVGARYFHQALQDLGFELYTELFDYKFDTMESERDRVEGVVANIKDLSKKREKVEATISKVKRNKQRAIELKDSLTHQGPVSRWVDSIPSHEFIS